MDKCSSRQILFLLFNFLFLCLGLGLVGFVAWTLATIPNANEFISGTHVVTLTSFCLGFVILIIGGIGCAAGFCKGLCILKTYVGFMLTLLFLELGLVFFIYAEKSQIPSVMINSWDGLNTDTQYQIQTELECCGIQNYTEYGTDVESYPSSCFVVYDVTGIIEKTVDNLFTVDCLTKMQTWLNDHVPIWVSVILVIAVIECLSGITSCIFLQRVQKKLKVKPEDDEDRASVDTEMAVMNAGSSNAQESDDMEDQGRDSRTTSTGLIIVTPAPEQEIKDNTTIDYLSERNIDTLSTKSNSDVKEETTDTTHSNASINGPSLILVASVSKEEQVVKETKDSVADNDVKVMALTQMAPEDVKNNTIDENDDSISNRGTSEPSVLLVASVTNGETCAIKNTTDSSVQDKENSSALEDKSEFGDVRDENKDADNISDYSSHDQSLIILVPVSRGETSIDKEVKDSINNDQGDTPTLTQTTPGDVDNDDDTISNHGTLDQALAVNASTSKTDTSSEKETTDYILQDDVNTLALEREALDLSIEEGNDETKDDTSSSHSLPDPTLLLVASVLGQETTVNETVGVTEMSPSDGTSNEDKEEIISNHGSSDPSVAPLTKDETPPEKETVIVIASVSHAEKSDVKERKDSVENEEVVSVALTPMIAVDVKKDGKVDITSDIISDHGVPDPSLIILTSDEKEGTPAEIEAPDVIKEEVVETVAQEQTDLNEIRKESKDDTDEKDDTTNSNQIAPDTSLIVVASVPHLETSDVKERKVSVENEEVMSVALTPMNAIGVKEDCKDDITRDIISDHGVPDLSLTKLPSEEKEGTPAEMEAPGVLKEGEVETVVLEQTELIEVKKESKDDTDDKDDTTNSTQMTPDTSLIVVASVPHVGTSAVQERKDSVENDEIVSVALTPIHSVDVTEDDKDDITSDIISDHGVPDPSLIILTSEENKGTPAEIEAPDFIKEEVVETLALEQTELNEITKESKDDTDEKDDTTNSNQIAPDTSLIVVASVPHLETSDVKERKVSVENEEVMSVALTPMNAFDVKEDCKDDITSDIISDHGVPDPSLIILTSDEKEGTPAEIEAPDVIKEEVVETVALEQTDLNEITKESKDDTDEKDDTTNSNQIAPDTSLIVVASVPHLETSDVKERKVSVENEEVMSVALTPMNAVDVKEDCKDDITRDIISDHGVPDLSLTKLPSEEKEGTPAEMEAPGVLKEGEVETVVLEQTELIEVKKERNDDTDDKDDTTNSTQMTPDTSLIVVASVPHVGTSAVQERKDSVENDEIVSVALTPIHSVDVKEDDKDDITSDIISDHGVPDPSLIILTSEENKGTPAEIEAPDVIKEEVVETLALEQTELNEITKESKDDTDEKDDTTNSNQIAPDTSLIVVASVPHLETSDVKERKVSVENEEVMSVALTPMNAFDVKEDCKDDITSDIISDHGVPDPSLIILTSDEKEGTPAEIEAPDVIKEEVIETLALEQTELNEITKESKDDTDEKDDTTNSNQIVPDTSLIVVASVPHLETSDVKERKVSVENEEVMSVALTPMNAVDVIEDCKDDITRDIISDHGVPDLSLTKLTSEEKEGTPAEMEAPGVLKEEVETVVLEQTELIEVKKESKDDTDDKDDTTNSTQMTPDTSLIVVASVPHLGTLAVQERKDSVENDEIVSVALTPIHSVDVKEDDKDDITSDIISGHGVPDPSLIILTSEENKGTPAEIEAPDVIKEEVIETLALEQTELNEITKESKDDTDEKDDTTNSNQIAPDTSLIVVASVPHLETSDVKERKVSVENEEVMSVALTPMNAFDVKEDCKDDITRDIISDHGVPDLSLTKLPSEEKEGTPAEMEAPDVLKEEVETVALEQTELIDVKKESKDDTDDKVDTTNSTQIAPDTSLIVVASAPHFETSAVKERNDSVENDEVVSVVLTPMNSVDVKEDCKDDITSDIISDHGVPDLSLTKLTSEEKEGTPAEMEAPDVLKEEEVETVALEQTELIDVKKESKHDTDDKDDTTNSTQMTPDTSLIVVASVQHLGTLAVQERKDSVENDEIVSVALTPINSVDVKEDDKDDITSDIISDHGVPDPSLILLTSEENKGTPAEIEAPDVIKEEVVETLALEQTDLNEMTKESKDDKDDTTSSNQMTHDASLIVVASVPHLDTSAVKERKDSVENEEVVSVVLTPMNSVDVKEDCKDDITSDIISDHGVPDLSLTKLTSEEKEGTPAEMEAPDVLKEEEVETVALEQTELIDVKKESKDDTDDKDDTTNSTQIAPHTSLIVVASVPHLETSDVQERKDSVENEEIVSVALTPINSVEVTEDDNDDITSDIISDHGVPDPSLIILTSEAKEGTPAEMEALDVLKEEEEAEEKKTVALEQTDLIEWTKENTDDKDDTTSSNQTTPDASVIVVASVPHLETSAVKERKVSVENEEVMSVALTPMTSVDVKEDDKDDITIDIISGHGVPDPSLITLTSEEKEGTPAEIEAPDVLKEEEEEEGKKVALEQTDLIERTKENTDDKDDTTSSNQTTPDASMIVVASVPHLETSAGKERKVSVENEEVMSVALTPMNAVDIKEDDKDDITSDIISDHVVPDPSLTKLTSEEKEGTLAEMEAPDVLKEEEVETVALEQTKLIVVKKESKDDTDDKDDTTNSTQMTPATSLVVDASVPHLETSAVQERKVSVENEEVTSVALTPMTSIDVKEDGKDDITSYIISEHGVPDPSIIMLTSEEKEGTLVEMEATDVLKEEAVEPVPLEQSELTEMIKERNDDKSLTEKEGMDTFSVNQTNDVENDMEAETGDDSIATQNTQDSSLKLVDMVSSDGTAEQEETSDITDNDDSNIIALEQTGTSDMAEDSKKDISDDTFPNHGTFDVSLDLAVLVSADGMSEKEETTDITETEACDATEDKKEEIAMDTTPNHGTSFPSLEVVAVVSTDETSEKEKNIDITKTTENEGQDTTSSEQMKAGDVKDVSEKKNFNDTFSDHGTYDPSLELVALESTDESSGKKETTVITQNTEKEVPHTTALEHMDAGDVTEDSKKENADDTIFDHGPHDSSSELVSLVSTDETSEKEAITDIIENTENEGPDTTALEQIEAGNVTDDSKEEKPEDTISDHGPSDSSSELVTSASTEETSEKEENKDITEHEGPVATALEEMEADDVTDDSKEEKPEGTISDHGPRDPSLQLVALVSTAETTEKEKITDNKKNESPDTTSLEQMKAVNKTDDSEEKNFDDSISDHGPPDSSSSELVTLTSTDDTSEKEEIANITEKIVNESPDTTPLEQMEGGDVTDDSKEEKPEDTISDHGPPDSSSELVSLTSTDDTSENEEIADITENEGQETTSLKQMETGDVTDDSKEEKPEDTISDHGPPDSSSELVTLTSTDDTSGKEEIADITENEGQDTTSLEQMEAGDVTDDSKEEKPEDTISDHGPPDSSSELVTLTSTDDTSEKEEIADITEKTENEGPDTTPLEQMEAGDVTDDSNEEKPEDTITDHGPPDSSSELVTLTSTDDTSEKEEIADITENEGQDTTSLKQMETGDVTDDSKEEKPEDTISDHGPHDSSSELVTLTSTDDTSEKEEIADITEKTENEGPDTTPLEQMEAGDVTDDSKEEKPEDTISDHGPPDSSSELVTLTSTDDTSEKEEIADITENEGQDTTSLKQMETGDVTDDSKKEKPEDTISYNGPPNSSSELVTLPSTDDTSEKEEIADITENQVPDTIALEQMDTRNVSDDCKEENVDYTILASTDETSEKEETTEDTLLNQITTSGQDSSTYKSVYPFTETTGLSVKENDDNVALEKKVRDDVDDDVKDKANNDSISNHGAADPSLNLVAVVTTGETPAVEGTADSKIEQEKLTNEADSEQNKSDKDKNDYIKDEPNIEQNISECTDKSEGEDKTAESTTVSTMLPLVQQRKHTTEEDLHNEQSISIADPKQERDDKLDIKTEQLLNSPTNTGAGKPRDTHECGNDNVSVEAGPINVTSNQSARDSEVLDDQIKDQKRINGDIDNRNSFSANKVDSKNNMIKEEAGMKTDHQRQVVKSDKNDDHEEDSDTEEYKDALDYVPEREAEEFTMAPEEKIVGNMINLQSNRQQITDISHGGGSSRLKNRTKKEAKETTVRHSKKPSTEVEEKVRKATVKPKQNSFKSKPKFRNPVIWK